MGRFSEDDLETYIELMSDELHGCCGVKVIYDLESYNDAVVRFNRKSALEYLKRYTNNKAPEGLAVVTLSEHQLKVWLGILEEAGFKMVSKGRNVKTGNAIFLFVKTIHKTNKPYKRSLVKKPKARGRKS